LKVGVLAATATFGVAAATQSQDRFSALFSRFFTTAYASDDESIHLAPYPWTHKGFLAAYDHNSIRRGFKVYQQVCASCHSLDVRLTFLLLQTIAI
jgi:cytochrome c1